MTEILFIRHAETDSAGTFCGQSDPDVNSVGHEQIEALVASLRGKHLQAVYSSDLFRARTTAEALARSVGVTCRLSPALREIDFGEWEGLTWDEIWKRDRTYAERWVEEFPSLPTPGGETFEAFRSRVLAEVKALARLTAGRRVAVVTHAGVLRIILQDLLGETEAAAWEKTKEYCCLVPYHGVNA
ncbi:histidine phosphatase family protein [Granulicella sibirica]|uniref:Alpha-ribazole-5'-phosphate phosphatase n=1 Tax=Granulicella sibirica TaxID=2479048 RepID=A0A4Q0SZZ9_9BACT|nr:histidine phosphatase family protein [Granulicella sibirica]RXH56913.1 Alpha-ribazole-5'-phosphate phosphatase [Granulicella sibirica]